jgi:anthranilate/para-aminobenzoate synthase component I
MIHLVSDISARPGVDASLSDIIRSLLPGASVTGAPKKRAVEIINDLELWPRSVYTGCLGYIYNGRADFNIAIRSMVHHNGRYQVHSGGGIVADSSPEAEYREMLLKVRNLLLALGVAEKQLTL